MLVMQRQLMLKSLPSLVVLVPVAEAEAVVVGIHLLALHPTSLSFLAGSRPAVVMRHTTVPRRMQFCA